VRNPRPAAGTPRDLLTTGPTALYQEPGNRDPARHPDFKHAHAQITATKSSNSREK